MQGGLMLVALIATVGAIIADIRRRRERNGVWDTAPRIARVAASLGAIAFSVTMVFLLMSTNQWDFQYGLPSAIAGVQATSPGVAIPAGLSIILSVLGVVTARARAGVLELILAVPAALLVLMIQWNLLIL